MEKSSLVPIGRVARTHGVRGAVQIYPYGETLGVLKAGEKLFVLSSENAVERELTLVGLNAHKRGWIGQFEEVGDMDSALGLAGKELSVTRDRLPSLPEGEYYHFELLGLSVETRDGRYLGVLQSILETTSNDVYVVSDGEKELLLPAIEDVVCEVDLENRKLIVDPPEGLE